MMPDTRGWRSSTPYDYWDDVDVDALAWECLRRNPDYQRDYAKIVKAPLRPDNDTEAIGNRWGLRFPRTAKLERPRAAHLLDPGNRYQCAAYRSRTETCADRPRRSRRY